MGKATLEAALRYEPANAHLVHQRLSCDIAECDATARELNAHIEQRTAWAERAVGDVIERDAVIRALQVQIEQQTAWAQQAVRDVIERDAIIHQLQATMVANGTPRTRLAGPPA